MFVALDVETANRDGASICQIGLVTFVDGEVVDEWQTLVNPRGRFHPGNVRVHGIRPNDVRDAPTFGAVAGEIHERTAGQIVVAHNAGFDRGCVAAACARERFAAPDARWLCTVRVARRAWADELPRFGLKVVAEHLGLAFRHHDALEDARTAGRILVAASERMGLTTREWLDRVERPVRCRAKPRATPGHLSISERALASRFGTGR